MSDAEELKKLLYSDERIIWQGKPSSRVQFEFNSVFPFLFILSFFVMALYEVIAGSEAGFLGYVFLGIFAFFLFGGHFWAAFKRSRTSYALTNKRAFISYRGPMGHKLDNFLITPDTTLELKEGRLNAVWFGQSEPKVMLDREPENDIGFERIDDPYAVYQLLRSVQRGTA